MSLPILTAAEMRAAEQRAVDAGTGAETLMERAGAAAAQAIWRYCNPMEALILCGPGNNGGDGYVIARHLKERGVRTRVAALSEPRSDAALRARSQWSGDVEPLGEAKGAPLLVDALFGTGLTRPLDPAHSGALLRLGEGATVRVAVDLPSGVATDDGAVLSPVPDYDLVIAFGALKPSHLLQPAARHMGRVVVADIGVETRSRLNRIARPSLAPPGPQDHKYSRGYVAVLGGEMAGAGALAAAAALRSGAGYVRLVADAPVEGVPAAVVQGRGGLDDPRIGALVMGPGLGRGPQAAERFEAALGLGHPLVLDADALFLLGGRSERLRDLGHTAILTPHSGEFERLFGRTEGSKVDQARAAAERAGSVVILKGADTVVAAPDGRAAIAASASHFLASAGTGDVMAGVAGAMRARGLEAFEAASAAVWLHGRAAEALCAGLVADDLAQALPIALGECS